MGEAKIVIPERGYFSLPRNAAQDGRLALATRGLLALMLSLPSDWDYTVTGLAIKAGCGREKMRRMIRELEDVGYLAREQSHGEGGQFGGNVYVLQETPPLDGFWGNGERENTTVAQECRQRQKPSTGFRPEQIKKDLNNPPYNPPKGDEKSPKSPKAPSRSGPREAPDWNPERFAKFWEAYPHKFRGNKQAAMDMWDRLHADDELLNEISHCLLILTRSSSWKAEIGIPHAKTFLNPRNERWKDAYDVEKDQEHSATSKAQPVRRIEQPPDSQDGGWTWAE